MKLYTYDAIEQINSVLDQNIVLKSENSVSLLDVYESIKKEISKLGLYNKKIELMNNINVIFDTLNVIGDPVKVDDISMFGNQKGFASIKIMLNTKQKGSTSKKEVIEIGYDEINKIYLGPNEKPNQKALGVIIGGFNDYILNCCISIVEACREFNVEYYNGDYIVNYNFKEGMIFKTKGTSIETILYHGDSNNDEYVADMHFNNYYMDMIHLLPEYSVLERLKVYKFEIMARTEVPFDDINEPYQKIVRKYAK